MITGRLMNCEMMDDHRGRLSMYDNFECEYMTRASAFKLTIEVTGGSMEEMERFVKGSQREEVQMKLVGESAYGSLAEERHMLLQRLDEIEHGGSSSYAGMGSMVASSVMGTPKPNDKPATKGDAW